MHPLAEFTQLPAAAVDVVILAAVAGAALAALGTLFRSAFAQAVR